MSDLGWQDIVDLERYPLDRLNSDAAQALISRCRETLDESALCTLPGFVRPDVIERMTYEANSIFPSAYRYDTPRIAYTEDGEDWPEGHPRTIEHDCRYHQALNYQIANDSLVRRLYLWPNLSEFIRQVLGYESLHRSDCPHLALTIQYAGDGDGNGWHFDGNDAVFSLLLQAPAEGGAFEYAPYLRTETDENYDGVSQVFADPGSLAQRPEITPGTLTLFKGDLSLHRVSPVSGTKRRVIALFSFDRQPGQVFPQSYIEELHACPQGV